MHSLQIPHTIDRSFEVSPWPADVPLPTDGAWLGSELDPLDCVVRLSDDALAEIAETAARMRDNPLPFTLRQLTDHPMPAVQTRMAQVLRLLETPGVAVLDRLPMDDLDGDGALALFWLLGQQVGRPVAQKWDGSTLYDVRDTGAHYAYGVRGSHTSVELVFHTDNAFAIAPPDRVGLLCIHPARSGGVSRFCSLHAVHQRMALRHPRLLDRLYQPMYWDRQAEHAPGAAPTLFAPMFRHHRGTLCTRINVSLVRKGYEVAEQTMDDALRDALSALESVSEAPELWFELAIQRGQLQYLDNVRTAHYRSAFKDAEEPGHRRHLVRTWHRDRGARSYDGQDDAQP